MLAVCADGERLEEIITTSKTKQGDQRKFCSMRSGIDGFSPPQNRANIIHSSPKMLISVQSARRIHPDQKSINPYPSPSQST